MARESHGVRRAVSAVRILPMSDKRPKFVGRDIADVQAWLFLRELPRRGGRYSYVTSGLKAEPGTVVLFQYQAHIVASGVFNRDEKIEDAKSPFAGELHFEVESLRVFDPIDVAGMRKVWPWFKAFGHAKQVLNPTLYSKFTRRLRNVKAVSGKTNTNAATSD